MGPHPAVAAVRLGVRRSLTGLRPQALVLAACSGGADSLALAAALAFEAPRLGLRAGGVTVDHGLQPGSAAQAARVTTILAGLGLDPVRCVTADVAPRGSAGAGPDPQAAARAVVGREAGAVVGREAGAVVGREAGAVVGREAGYPGPEGAARAARYAALDDAADELGAAVILLGHTMDDQAETVLLGLARGSGARSLAGMAPASGRYLRPLLGLRRERTRAACAAAGLEPWEDPHNTDPAYTRVRVRARILPLMEELLGPGVTEALARTADQLRADADALDAIAGERAVSLLNASLAETRAGRQGDRTVDGGTPDPQTADRRPVDGRTADGPCPNGQTVDVVALAALPAAIRTRLLRMAAIAAGSPGGALTARHVADLDALVTGWHGQRWADLPGGVRCQRRHDRLVFIARA